MKWILEADINGCFDNISHTWLLDHIPTDTTILGKWLQSGVIDEGMFYNTEVGTPQGGIISPVLANMTLDGLENAIKNAVSSKDKICVVRYADDFIVTAHSKELLEQAVKPAIEQFLSDRGLQLSETCGTNDRAISHARLPEVQPKPHNIRKIKYIFQFL
jgi:RNA-directed DNA polymerase